MWLRQKQLGCYMSCPGEPLIEPGDSVAWTAAKKCSRDASLSALPVAHAVGIEGIVSVRIADEKECGTAGWDFRGSKGD